MASRKLAATRYGCLCADYFYLYPYACLRSFGNTHTVGVASLSDGGRSGNLLRHSTQPQRPANHGGPDLDGRIGHVGQNRAERTPPGMGSQPLLDTRDKVRGCRPRTTLHHAEGCEPRSRDRRVPVRRGTDRALRRSQTRFGSPLAASIRHRDDL